MRVLHSCWRKRFNTPFQQWPHSAKQWRAGLFMCSCSSEHKQLDALANWKQTTNKGPDALIHLQGWRGTKWVNIYIIIVACNWSSVVGKTVIYKHVAPLLGIHINQAKVQHWEKNSDKIPSFMWIFAMKEAKQNVLSNAYSVLCGLEVETPPQETEKEHIMSVKFWDNHTHSWDSYCPRSISEKQTHVMTHTLRHLTQCCELTVKIMGVKREWWEEWQRKAIS